MELRAPIGPSASCHCLEARGFGIMPERQLGGMLDGPEWTLLARKGRELRAV